MDEIEIYMIWKFELSGFIQQTCIIQLWKQTIVLNFDL